MPQFRSLPSFQHDAAEIEESVTPVMSAQPVSQPLTLRAFAAVSTEQFVKKPQDRQGMQGTQEPNTDALSQSRPFTHSPEQVECFGHSASPTYPTSPFTTRRLSHSSYALPQQQENDPITGPTTGFSSDSVARNSPMLSLVPFQQTPNTFTPIAPLVPVPTSSLITALQSTMAAHRKTDQVVIPATMKRTQVLPETLQAPRRMRRRVRHGLALVITFAVLLLTMLSLAPLDDGQSIYHFFAIAVEWGNGQQHNWEISQHTIAQLPGNGGSAGEASGASGSGATGSSNLPSMDLPTSQYIAIAQQDAIDAGISPVYFVRQIYAESSFNPNAYSPAGAIGIAQFEPSTAYSLGIDPYDPISALKGAAQLMASYNAEYGGDYAKALSAYNAGGGNVQLAVQNCGANWLSCMPVETQNYVYKIMGI